MRNYFYEKDLVQRIGPVWLLWVVTHSFFPSLTQCI